MYELEIGHSSLKNIIRQTNAILNDPFFPDVFVELQIDFSFKDFVKPYKLAVVVSFVEYLRSKEVIVAVKCVNVNQRNINYFSRMDFFRELNLEYEECFSRHDESGRFVPIRRINEENRYRITGEVTRIIQSQWEGVDNSIIASLDWSISEIIDNIFNHSLTTIDGFINAQYFPSRSEIDVIVIDSGIGIAQRLKENPEYSSVDSKEALSLAISQGVTVNPRTNVGAGLYYTKRIIEENRGLLEIFSKDASLCMDENGLMVEDSDNWDGTIIRLSINANILISPEKIWDNIPPSVDDYLYDGTLW